MLREADVTSLKSQLHYLNTSYTDDPAVQLQVQKALADINNLGKVAAAQLAQPAAGSVAAAAGGEEAKTFLTAEACKQCHAREYQIWTDTKHAHAMDILVAKGADFNPDCVTCHVLAFKKKGGFVDAKSTPTLANVQCESCHGPGARHVQNPAAPYGKAGQPSCVGCHNHENSPSFDFGVYWPKIQHGS
jgi:hypothetical protein